MTREEAIEIIKSIDKAYRTFSKEEYNALEMAIKALEQEPFMNKPCVAHQVCHEDKVKVLNKIRAEIAQKARPNEFGGRENGKSIRYGLCIALGIIDKYKGESEDKDGHFIPTQFLTCDDINDIIDES